MKITTLVTHDEIATTGYRCNRCNVEFDMILDVFEVQEMLHIDFTGGYGSIFGDGSTVEADLCQSCVRELLGEHLVVTPLAFENGGEA